MLTGDIIDILMFIILLGLLAGILWFIKLLNDVDQTKINKYCEKSPGVTIKADSISVPGLIKLLSGNVPPNDVQINFKLNC
jgi:hypothetical protein